MSLVEIVRPAPVTSALQANVDRWLKKHQREIQSFEGEILENDDGTADISGWLPNYNSGVYIVAEYSCPSEDSDCEACGETPFGFRTCTPRMKIGRATDFYTRLASIKTSSSRHLVGLALMPFKNPWAIERELHQLFASQKIDCGRKTEWYWHCAELEDLIVEVASSGGEPPCR